jgi:hypothetical protein
MGPGHPKAEAIQMLRGLRSESIAVIGRAMATLIKAPISLPFISPVLFATEAFPLKR